MKYAKVIVDIEAKALDKPYTYKIPNHMESDIHIGTIVNIPFGKGNRMIQGYTVELLSDIEKQTYELKSIDSFVKGLSIEGELLSLAVFMSKRYICTLQTALKTMIPTKQPIKNKTVNYIYRTCDIDDLKKEIAKLNGERSKSRKQVYKYLLEHKKTTYNILNNLFATSMSVLKTCEKNGFIRIEKTIVSRDPFATEVIKATQALELNDEQTLAIESIKNAMEKKASEIFLLHGKTGTGKTEIYMQVIQKALDQGQSSIMLIPEIGLTPQTMKRFIGRFGDQVGIIHSKLSKGERFDQWTKAKEGQIKIMVGPRSAIFAPFQNIGAIIIDESHESTYKSDTNPKYHAREIAIKRAHMHRCPVILGTATPLVENYYKALKGDYQLLPLLKRFGAYNSKNTQIVDMREVLASGNTSIISPQLDQAIQDALSKKQQIILFLNRRGHSNFISCRNCGHVLKCESCDMPYTYHSAVERLICHYCGKSEQKPRVCPSCGSKHIKTFGVGTQQVEKVLLEGYQGVRVTRMDFDTTAMKGGHAKILDGFLNHEQDILVGTQMIAKGHHFSNVSLVGVLAADLSLYVNDFRASERTFQLINQVIGRTGRGDIPGQSIIQTYTPEHMSIQCAKNDNYIGFYNEEIQLRNLLGYPPFTVLMNLLIQGTDEAVTIKIINQIKEDLESYCLKLKIHMVGPSPSGVRKIKNRYRWHLFFKSNNYKEIQMLAFYINDIKMKYMSDTINNITVDINPSYM